MTGTERIKEKIRLDAEAVIQQRLDEAKAEADAIVAEAVRKRQLAAEETDRLIEAGKSAQTRRHEAALQSDMRKQTLAARQQLVEDAFQKAAEAIVGLPDADYAALLSSMLLKAAWRGDAEIVVSARDRARLGDAWLADMTAKRSAKGLTGTIRYAADVLPSDGGFVVRSGEMEINGTLAVLLAGIRPRLEAQVARTLFG